MSQQNVTEFGGVAGAVLRHAISWPSLVTGLTLGFIALVTGFVFTVVGAPAVASLFIQALIAVALARFALNGIHGEWSGTLFSSRGGSWAAVGAVAARYLALTAIWLLPLFFLGLKDSAVFVPQASPTGLPMPGGGAIAVVMAYVVISTISPPIFLVVAVSATGFGDLFSKEHWVGLFSGRIADLGLIYAVYAGALGMCIVLGFPIVMGLFSVAWPLALLFGGLGVALILGLAVDLLGRLCGFFAFGEAGHAPAGREESVYGGGPETGGPSRVETAGPAPATGPAVAAEAAAVPVSTIPVSTVPATATASTMPAAAASTAAPAAGLAVGPGKPVFREAKPFMEDAWKRFKHDPDGAIAEVREARDNHAPHPLLHHGLCLMLHHARRTPETLEAARDAMKVCLGGGQVYLGAELFRTLWAHHGELGLEPEQILQIAQVLARKDDLTLAANSFALVILEDPSDIRAVKGMLQIAELLLHKRQKHEDALRLYRYLLSHCADSPLSDFMRQGFEDAERRTAQARAS